MTFHEFGDKTLPHVMLIHGGGNAWWNYLRQARAMSGRYHVILPTLDGHGEEHSIPYISTEETADKLMDYINEYCNGHLFALCGVSLGGQIVMELLARKVDLAEKAIIDGSLCDPQPVMAHLCIALCKCLEDSCLVKKPAVVNLSSCPKCFHKRCFIQKKCKRITLRICHERHAKLCTRYTVLI